MYVYTQRSRYRDDPEVTHDVDATITIAASERYDYQRPTRNKVLFKKAQISVDCIVVDIYVEHQQT